jgi:hypothetical protein
MGVDVWRERCTAAGLAPLEAPVAAVPVRKALGRDRGGPRADVGPADRAEHALAAASAPDAGQAQVSAFSVLCLRKDNAVLIAEPRDLKTGRRFAVDLLSSVTGTWGGRHDQLVFDWPQPGIDGSRGAAERALRAFVDKQAADSPDGIVMVAQEVVDRLGTVQVPDRWVVIPVFDELMTRGEMKRTLWGELARRATS